MTTDTSPRDEAIVEAEGREINVLVTGYGPFLDQFPVNVSWSIASTLPRYIPPTASLPHRIRIIIPDKPLRVSYAHVAATTPHLLAGTSANPSSPPLPKPDIILHIGLAAGRGYYTLERQSTRGPYDRYPDVDGRTISASESADLFGDNTYVLKPTIDTDDVWRRWRTNVADVSADLRPSDDPGRYLCGFIYYLSMAWLAKNRRERPVVFLHVPDLPSEVLVAQGREVAVGLIKALVANQMSPRTVETLGTTEMDVAEEEKVEMKEGWSGISDINIKP